MKYKIVKEKILDRQIGEYYTYGISLDNGKIISDVSTEYKRLNAFIANLNKYSVSPKHIDYFIQEFLEGREGLINFI